MHFASRSDTDLLVHSVSGCVQLGSTDHSPPTSDPIRHPPPIQKLINIDPSGFLASRLINVSTRVNFRPEQAESLICIFAPFIRRFAPFSAISRHLSANDTRQLI